MRTEAILMNRRFLLAHRLKRPYIILKWAQSVDGFIAPDQVGPYWMTSDASRCLVHAWRAREASILVGRLTAQMDNPRLTARCPPDGPMGPNPTRVVLDPEGRLTPDLHLFDSAADTIVFSRVSRNDAGRTSRICLRSEESLIFQVCCHLYERDLISVIVEGGTRTLQGFIDSGVWDEARVFVTPSPLKKGTVAPQFPHTSAFQYSVGDDELYRYFHPDLYSRLGIMESMQTGSLLAMVEERV
jgi:diaminohydroxyphosphoribosylaminopyrimidine deaminase/5-amino-6-(5-phosphoribosylamino)uracil reductase